MLEWSRASKDIKFFILKGTAFLRECQAITYDEIITEFSNPVGMITGMGKKVVCIMLHELIAYNG